LLQATAILSPIFELSSILFTQAAWRTASANHSNKRPEILGCVQPV